MNTMTKEQRKRVCLPYLDRLHEAQGRLNSLKQDTRYLEHLKKIYEAEMEVNKVVNELDDLLGSL